jgi:hypothetical protein
MADAAILKNLEDGNVFYDIDRMYGAPADIWNWAHTKGDLVIDYGNIQKAADDGMVGAQQLLNNMRLFRDIDSDGNGQLTAGELKNLYASVRAQIAKMEADAKAGASGTATPGQTFLGRNLVNPDGHLKVGGDDGTTIGTARNPGSSSGAHSPGGTTSTSAPRTTDDPKKADDSKKTDGTSGTDKEKKAAEVDKALEPPYPYKPKAKDPEGRINEANQYLEDYVDKLQQGLADAAAEGDTAKSQAIQAKLTKITMCQQMIAQLQQQLFTQASNMLKLYGDMAMTAIRNSH